MNGNGARLEGVTKELRANWLQTREYWRDAKAAEFERTYLDELFNGVEKTINVIDHLDKLIGKIKKDCE